MRAPLRVVLGLGVASAVINQPYAQLNITGPQPTVAGQIGTSQVQRGLTAAGDELITKRVAVIAYCADLAPNADDAGIFGREEFQEGLARFVDSYNQNAPCPGCLKNPILDASTVGYFGAQNLVDMILYDDGIPRFRDVVLIDGDRELPTAQELVQNFDCVIAYTDNQCGVPIPPGIANSAARALADFAAVPGKGVVLTGFSFNTSIGLGNAVFGGGLSPIRKASAAVDPRCTPPDPAAPGRGACPIGQCPQGAVRQFPVGFVPPETGAPVTAPECFACPEGCTNAEDPLHPGLTLCQDATDTFCGVFQRPIFQPVTVTADAVCESLLQGVNGPTSSSFANALTTGALAPRATLCANYDAPAADLPLLAVNEGRNVVALNVFPAYAPDLQKTWFSCIVANAAIYACGERRCIANGDGTTTCN